jgi:hypothetical protein
LTILFLSKNERRGNPMPYPKYIKHKREDIAKKTEGTSTKLNIPHKNVANKYNN